MHHQEPQTNPDDVLETLAEVLNGHDTGSLDAIAHNLRIWCRNLRSGLPDDRNRCLALNDLAGGCSNLGELEAVIDSYANKLEQRDEQSTEILERLHTILTAEESGRYAPPGKAL